MPEPTTNGMPPFDFDVLQRRATYARGRAARTAGRAEVRLVAEQVDALVKTFQAVEARAAAAEAAVQRIAEVRRWVNRDGKRFLFESDVLVALALDWTAADEAAHAERKAAGFPTSYYEDAPPFTPLRISQFRAGFEHERQQIEATEQRRDPRAPLLPDASLHQRLRDAMQHEASEDGTP